MAKINATRAFSKNLRKYLKLNEHTTIEDYSKELEEAFNYIKSLVGEDDIKLVSADKYFQYGISNGDLNPEMENIFKKYKPFQNENLNFIFVLGRDCEGILKCSVDCGTRSSEFVCLYDVFYE